jgi:hypothetical protein
MRLRRAGFYSFLLCALAAVPAWCAEAGKVASVEFVRSGIESVRSQANSIADSISHLAPVALSGNYNDLTNKPTIPAAYTHPTIARTDTNDGQLLGSGSVFLAVDNISSDANGHITSVHSNLLAMPVIPSVGTTSGTVAAGNDSRIVNAVQKVSGTQNNMVVFGASGAIADSGIRIWVE